MDSQEYTVVALDGMEYPSIDFETIKDWYRRKLLNENSLISSPQTGGWKMLKNVFDLNELNAERNSQYRQNRPPEQSFSNQYHAPQPAYYPPFTPGVVSPPPAKSRSYTILKVVLVLIGAFWLVDFGLARLYTSGHSFKNTQTAAGRDRALAELKKYELPGTEFTDPKSGAKVKLPAGWRMLSLENPVIFIANQKEDDAELKRLNMTSSTMLAADASGDKILLLEIVNFPFSIDKKEFFEKSAKVMEEEIIKQSKPGTYQKISEFSTVLASGLAKKVIFEKVSNINNPNASSYGIIDTDAPLKGQMIVMSNSHHAFIFQMWTQKDMYEQAVPDFNFWESNFTMPKD